MKKLSIVLLFSALTYLAAAQSNVVDNLVFKFEAKLIDKEQSLVQITGCLINNSTESISFLTNKCDDFEGYLESNSVRVTPRLGISCNAYIAQQHLIEASSKLEFKAVIRKECVTSELALDFLFIPIDKGIEADGKIISYLIEELELKTHKISGLSIIRN